MVWGIQQKSEIQTIRERNIKLKLSDADCQRLAEKAAKAGETIETLIEGFIGDLVNGTYTHGSDEVDYAEAWFERSHSFMPEKTFLSYLIEYGDVNEVIENLSNIKDMKKDIEVYKKELETGILLSGGTWKDIQTSYGSGILKDAYSSKEEWESEWKACIIDNEEWIEGCEASINEYWEEYVQSYKVAEPDMDKEIKQILEWSGQLAAFKGENINSLDTAIDEAMQAVEFLEPGVEL